MKTSVIVAIVCSVLVGYAASKGLPSFIKICHRHDPQINACLDENMKKIIPHLKEGIPDLYIPPFSPLIIPFASLDSAGNFNASFTNITILDLDRLVITERSLDLDRLRLEMSAEFPNVRVQSHYNVVGKVLVLQLDAHGPADGNLTNVSGKLVANGKPYTKNGKTHVKWEPEKIEMNLGKPVVKFYNIFGDNEELNARTNQIVNDNIDELIGEVIPVVKKVIGDFIFGIANKLFEKFSMDELFPDP